MLALCFVLCSAYKVLWSVSAALKIETPATSKIPTWLCYNFQVKLHLRPPSNHRIDIGVSLGDGWYGEGVFVSICSDYVRLAVDYVLCAALPFDFSVGLLRLRLKHHTGALFRLLSLWLLDKGRDYGAGVVGDIIQVFTWIYLVYSFKWLCLVGCLPV